jgi:hypothetical protein
MVESHGGEVRRSMDGECCQKRAIGVSLIANNCLCAVTIRCNPNCSRWGDLLACSSQSKLGVETDNL